MLLYLIRHTEAVDLGTPGAARDFDRVLTPHGRDQARSLGAAFARLSLPLDAVVASPLVRAHQTAVELIAAALPGARPVTCDQLAPERLKPGKLSDFFATTPGEHVAAVGHMPELASYLEWLVGAPDGHMPLEKGACACVSFRGNPAKAAGRLEWVVTPEWFI